MKRALVINWYCESDTIPKRQFPASLLKSQTLRGKSCAAFPAKAQKRGMEEIAGRNVI